MKDDKIKAMFSGIKCDNPNCDWCDKNANFDDYDSYVDKKCPKCGMRLLTKECNDECRHIMNIIENTHGFFNKMKLMGELVPRLSNLPYLGRTDDELAIMNGEQSGPKVRLNL